MARRDLCQTQGRCQQPACSSGVGRTAWNPFRHHPRPQGMQARPQSPAPARVRAANTSHPSLSSLEKCILGIKPQNNGNTVHTCLFCRMNSPFMPQIIPHFSKAFLKSPVPMTEVVPRTKPSLLFSWTLPNSSQAHSSQVVFS